MFDMGWKRPSFSGMNIIWNDNALEATGERLFPESRHRSARIRKKLIKRHGGEFRMKPCIWQVGTGYNQHFVAHPSFKSEMERQINKTVDRSINNAMMYGSAFL